QPPGRRGGDQGRPGGDGAGQADGAADVRGPGRSTVADAGALLDPSAVDVASAEADTERSGERGLALARVGAGVAVPVAEPALPGAARVTADGGGGGRREQRGQPGRGPGGDVVQAGRRPAEPRVPHGAVADHRVEGVDRAVAE